MTLRQVNKDQRVRVSCTVNGVKRLGYAEPRTLLSDFLRHELGLYGVCVGRSLIYSLKRSCLFTFTAKVVHEFLFLLIVTI